MKKILLLAVVVVTTVASASAEYLERGMYLYHHDKATRNGEFVSDTSARYVFENDTVVGGETYLQLVCYTDFNKVGEVISETEPKVVALVREDDGKIYCIRDLEHGDAEGKLVFDYNMKSGDKVEVYPLDYLLNADNYSNPTIHHFAECTGAGSVLSGGKTLETIEFRHSIVSDLYPDEKAEDTYTYFWMKGAGNLSIVPIVEVYKAQESKARVADPDLKYENTDVLYSADGKVICDYRDIKVLNSNVTGVSEVSTVSKGGMKYNIDGTQHHDGQKGVYVLDGKKYVER